MTGMEFHFISFYFTVFDLTFLINMLYSDSDVRDVGCDFVAQNNIPI